MHIIPGAIGILSIIENLLINLLLCFVVHHINNQYWYTEILKNNKYLTSQSKESIISITIWVNCVQSKLRKEISEKGLSYAQGDCDCHDCVQTRRERVLYNSVADVMQHGRRCGRRVGSGRLRCNYTRFSPHTPRTATITLPASLHVSSQTFITNIYYIPT